MMVIRAFLLLFFTLPIFSSASSLSLSKSTQVRIKYGYKHMDEFFFEKKKNHFEVHFIDRSSKRGERISKRAFPMKLAEQRVFQFEYLLKRFEKKISLTKGLPCAKKLNVEMGSGKKVQIKNYCLESLTKAEETQFVTWITETTSLF